MATGEHLLTFEARETQVKRIRNSNAKGLL